MEKGDWVIGKKTGKFGEIFEIDGEYATIGRYEYKGKIKVKLSDLELDVNHKHMIDRL